MRRILVFIVQTLRKWFAQLLKFFGMISRLRYKEIRADTQTKINSSRHIITDADRREFIDYCLNNQQDKSNFVPLKDSHFKRKDSDPKIIAYYLPQFYQFPQNDEWHGRGFTEWTNVTKATPQWTWHYQPRLPIDVGFYNLDTTDTMRRQIELAKQYGIYGFCFYYYWFHGEKLMEKPINNFLNDESLDLPFCLFWANEDWTMNWGEESAIGQKVYDASISDGDARHFVADILPFFKDERYITIDGHPVLCVYQHKDKNIKKFIKDIGEECEKHCMQRPYIMMLNNNADPKFNPLHFGADAATEFNLYIGRRPKRVMYNQKLMNPNARIKWYFDMQKFIDSEDFMYETDYPLYRGCMTCFDNTARKIYGTGATMCLMTPDLYYKWLSKIVQWTNEQQKEKLVFVSAWNEWAEAMYLEPDQKYGYAYLDATRKALEENRS